MKKKLLVAATTLAALSVATVPALAAGDAAAGQEKSKACIACHMADGNSVVPTWPKLAGQSAKYIVKQLKAFKTKQRLDETMAGQVQFLSEQDMEDLAAYFSSQSVSPGNSSKPELVNMGKQIYRKGNIEERVFACKGCHGLKGAGNHATLESIKAAPVLNSPALSSQHATYVVKQLKAFRDGTRKNDVGKTMRNIAIGMTDDDIEAVAEYIVTLN